MMDKLELKQMIRQCEAMEFGSPRLKAALHVLSLAEENGDPWCLIAANYFVASGYLMSDDRAKALPYCAEYLQLLEQHPSIKPDAIFELYIAMSAVYIAMWQPQISLEQGKALLEQFEARCKRYNTGWEHFYASLFSFHIEMGLLEEAAKIFERLRIAKPTAGWDCEGCRVGSIAACLLELGRGEEALSVAQPLLEGVVTCAHGSQPGKVLKLLLVYELEHGNLDQASQRVARLTRIGFRERGDLSALSACLLYYAFTAPERSLGMLEKGIAWSLGQLDADDLFNFYRSGWAICAALGRTHELLALQLPKKFVRYQKDGLYDAQGLSKWYYQKAVEIAGKFDRRNGTEQYAQKLQWVEKGIGLG